MLTEDHLFWDITMDFPVITRRLKTSRLLEATSNLAQAVSPFLAAHPEDPAPANDRPARPLPGDWSAPLLCAINVKSGPRPHVTFP